MSLKAKTEERAEILSQMGEAIEAMKNEQDTNNLRSKQDEFKNLKSIKERLDVEIETLSIVDDFNKSVDTHKEKLDFSRHTRSHDYRAETYEDGDKAMRALVMQRLGWDVPTDFEECLAKSNFRNKSKITLNVRTAQGIGTKGTNLAVDTLSSKLIEVKKYYGSAFSDSNVFVLNTDQGTTHKIPKVNSTTDDQYVLAHDENDTVDSATKEVDIITSNVKAYATGVFPISLESIRDMSFPIWDYAAKSLGKDIARKENTLFTTGATSEHAGILPQATLGWQTTDASTSFKWTDVLKLIKTIDKEYRDSPKFALMMHDSIYFELLAFADTTTAPLFLQNLTSGGELRLFGYKIIINNALPSACVADAKVILAGDFDQFLVRHVGGVDIIPLNEYLAPQLSVGMLAWASSGCCMLDSTAVKYLKMKSA